MATFTRDWDEATPAGTDYANTLDTAIQNFKIEVSDRLKTLIYGFVAGENDGKPGCKNLIFKQQSSAPSTPNADEISLYALDDGSNCGLYAKNENGYTKLILQKVGSDLQLAIEAADITADLINQDKIRLDNNSYLTARNAAGSGDINCIKVNASDVPEILVGAVLSADTAPASDAAVANKKYVDDQLTAAIAGAGFLKYSGETILNDAVTGGAASTFADLDISANIGSNRALCLIEVTADSTVIFMVRPKGFGRAAGSGDAVYHFAATGDYSTGASHTRIVSGYYAYLVVMADSSGVIQIASNSATAKFTLKLVCYVK